LQRVAVKIERALSRDRGPTGRRQIRFAFNHCLSSINTLGASMDEPALLSSDTHQASARAVISTGRGHDVAPCGLIAGRGRMRSINALATIGIARGADACLGIPQSGRRTEIGEAVDRPFSDFAVSAFIRRPLDPMCRQGDRRNWRIP
jgi:hypothetical protein